MSSKAVREYHGKKLVAKQVGVISEGRHVIDDRSVLVNSENSCDYDLLLKKNAWLNDGSCSLVVKPDQLIKRRGKAGLVGMNLSFEEVKEWIEERMQKEIKVEGVVGELDHFIVEPFIKHESKDEYYICIQSDRTGEEVLFYHEGGVDVGDVDAKAERMHVEIDSKLEKEELLSSSCSLLSKVPKERVNSLASFVVTLFEVFRKMNFTYMEINPIVFLDEKKIIPLDLAAKIDEIAAFLNAWLNDGSCSLVVKPDQLIKRRGKAGLVGMNLSFEEVKEWIEER